MLDREQDKLINESLFGRAKDTGLDIAKHLNVADQLYQAVSAEKDPSQITDDDIDNLVLAWMGEQEWLPAEFSSGLSEYLGQYLKNRRNDTVSDAGDAYGRSDAELPFSR
tara:strand:- start:685 stop:1014 length:330 start_codon:yes stop_codon:yes gene_type:complete